MTQDLLTAAKEALDFIEYVQFMGTHIVNPELATDLRAAIAEAEKAEPVAWVIRYRNRTLDGSLKQWAYDWDRGLIPNDYSYAAALAKRSLDDYSADYKYQVPLYLHHAPTIPEGWQLVPKEPTQDWAINYGHKSRDGSIGKNEVDELTQQIADMLAAAPEYEGEGE